MRIASLLPSATESLFAIDAGELIVARSHECDYPIDTSVIPAVTAQSLPVPTDPGWSASDIDQQVSTATGAGKPLYSIDEDALLSLSPDLIVTQDLCSVCSIDLETVRSVADRIGQATGKPPEVVSLNPETFEDVLDDLLRLGAATGREAQADRALEALMARTWRAQQFVNAYAEGPVVGFLEWTDPLFIAGHWNVQLIERAGGRHPLNETRARDTAGAAAGPMQAERVAGASIRAPAELFAATEPAWLVIAPCGLDLDATRREAQQLMQHEWFRKLPAVRTGRVALVDGSANFNRPGPRLVDGLEFLVGFIHDRPELIPKDFPWERMAP